MDDKLLDEFIDRLMEYVEINESRPPAEYVRTYLHPILAAERERICSRREAYQWGYGEAVKKCKELKP